MDTNARERSDIVGELYEAEYDNVVRLVACLLDDVARCEDIAQEALVRLLTVKRLPPTDKLAAYLRSTALNLARSTMRRRVTATKYQPVLAASRRAGPTDPAVRVEREFTLRALRALPRRQCEVLTLRYHYQLSEHEIAETLGISPGSVKTHAHRGLATLAETDRS